eukprot:5454721-Prymnesium_polylepis.1
MGGNRGARDTDKEAGAAAIKETLDFLPFALQLLSPQNDAVAPMAQPSFGKPLAHYWTACSHNSCMLPGLEPWLTDSHPLNTMTGVRIPVRQTSWATNSRVTARRTPVRASVPIARPQHYHS